MRASGATTTRIYRMADLTRETGFSERTIRFMISIGAVPHAHGRGPAAYYTDEHLRTLMEIRAERDRRVTLADFAERRAMRSYRSAR